MIQAKVCLKYSVDKVGYSFAKLRGRTLSPIERETSLKLNGVACLQAMPGFLVLLYCGIVAFNTNQAATGLYYPEHLKADNWDWVEVYGPVRTSRSELGTLKHLEAEFDKTEAGSRWIERYEAYREKYGYWVREDQWATTLSKEDFGAFILDLAQFLFEKEWAQQQRFYLVPKNFTCPILYKDCTISEAFVKMNRNYVNRLKEIVDRTAMRNPSLDIHVTWYLNRMIDECTLPKVRYGTPMSHTKFLQVTFGRTDAAYGGHFEQKWMPQLLVDFRSRERRDTLLTHFENLLSYGVYPFQGRCLPLLQVLDLVLDDPTSCLEGEIPAEVTTGDQAWANGRTTIINMCEHGKLWHLKWMKDNDFGEGVR